MSKLDAEYHINGVVTTRRYLKSNEDTVRRFMRAYIEGAARGQKDKAFALKAMGRTFRTDDRELLEESYDTDHQKQFCDSALSFRAGNCELDTRDWSRPIPKAKTAKPEEFADSRTGARDRSERIY